MYRRGTDAALFIVQMLFSVAPGQQLYYYGARTWPDDVRKKLYEQFGGSPKDLLPVHDYDPKVNVDARSLTSYCVPSIEIQN